MQCDVCNIFCPPVNLKYLLFSKQCLQLSHSYNKGGNSVHCLSDSLLDGDIIMAFAAMTSSVKINNDYQSTISYSLYCYPWSCRLRRSPRPWVAVNSANFAIVATPAIFVYDSYCLGLSGLYLNLSRFSCPADYF